MPYKRSRSARFPSGSISLTLVGSSDWSKNLQLLKKVVKSNSIFEKGTFFACNESYGGNTLNLLYPFIHVSDDGKIAKTKMPKIDNSSERREWFEQGAYIEIDHAGEDSDDPAHMIFIGIQKMQDALPSRIESTWRNWSKISLLTSELAKCKIRIHRIAFMRQIAPRSLSLFQYCFFVNIGIRTKSDQIKCLNVLQKLRGSVVPGYISLFQKTSTASELKRQRSRSFDDRHLNGVADDDEDSDEDSLEDMISNLEHEETASKKTSYYNNRRRRQTRSVNTV